VVAGSGSASTLIFDEIDAGTGGETAHRLADSLVRASGSRQIIVISHLAHIASRADRHLAVTKDYRNGMPVTTVSALETKEQQLTELTRLLGGGTGAREHAISLLGGLQ
jgi:DNA repair protein RecN (Recombination protein N)